jgi:UDP-3-O-[3-hydroxymyristoyl] N-acetylglucosamine deacetylase
LNYTLRKQRTIGRAVHVEGFGYWSGRDVRIEFRPAAADTGIVFVRGDLDPPRAIPALAKHRIEVPRRTTLAAGGGTVEMVEHITAALAGLRIDNCEVWASGAEMPGCDGSSQAFVEALLSAEIVEQAALRSQRIVTEVTRVGDDECWVEARPSPTPGLFVKYRLRYDEAPAIGRQTLELKVTPESFRKELAPARTFLLKQEADWLRERGLGARVTCRDVLVFDDEGPVDNSLRYKDECVRHKTLDLLGDLALAGCDIVGQIVAHRSGHRLNYELVKALLSEGQIVEGRRKTA